MSKPKIAFYWCASCGGCEESIVDLAEDLLTVTSAVDIVFMPVAMDFKKRDVEAMADNELAVAFINGAVRTSEQLEMAELLRRKAQLVIAYGSCAHQGGIPGLANLFNMEALLQKSYTDAPSVTNPGGTRPQAELKVPEGIVSLPKMHDTVKALDQVIAVDYYLPGCPPSVKLVLEALTAILEGKLPERGAILAPDLAICHECTRRDSKPDKLYIKEFKRPHQVLIDPEQCLLAQGVLCMGPVTRLGCGAACLGGNMPCTGCQGPTDRVRDYGAKALSAISSNLDASEDEEIVRLLDGIVDPAGTFYRYSLPASLLHSRIAGDGGKEA